MLTLITPTGDRPVPFRECVWYVRRSTLKPDLWIVVDDGADPATREALDAPPCPVCYLHPPAMEGHSLNRNLRLAAEQVPAGSDVAILEDDDYYPADYLAATVAILRQGFHTCGARIHHYYNLGLRGWRAYGNSHTLCTHSLAFDPEGFAFFAEEVVFATESINVDNELGERWPYDRLGSRGHEKVLPVHCLNWRCCTARPGTTRAHGRKLGGKYQPDPELAKLIEWTGSEADARRLIEVEEAAFSAIGG